LNILFITALFSSSGYSSGEAQQKSLKILKRGILLKKKDILAGWQVRFFVLQQGRISYYSDESAYRSGGRERGIEGKGEDYFIRITAQNHRNLSFFFFFSYTKIFFGVFFSSLFF
jgi:PH domain